MDKPCTSCRLREAAPNRKTCEPCLLAARERSARQRKDEKALMATITEEQVKEAIREMVEVMARICEHSESLTGMAPATRKEAHRLAGTALSALHLLESTMRPAGHSQRKVLDPFPRAERTPAVGGSAPSAAPAKRADRPTPQGVPAIASDPTPPATRAERGLERLAELVERIELKWDGEEMSDDVYAMLEGAIGALEGMLALMKGEEG